MVDKEEIVLAAFSCSSNKDRGDRKSYVQNIEYLDKNHGGILNIFDRMFGTWKPLDDEVDIRYGVIHAPNSYNPLVILTHEFKDIWKDVKSAKKLSHMLMYIFGPPGWSPDGSTLTVKQMQEQQQQQMNAGLYTPMHAEPWDKA